MMTMFGRVVAAVPDQHLVLVALEELHPELVFELGERQRERGLGHEALLGGAPEMALLGQGDDVAELGEGHGWRPRYREDQW